MTPPVELLVLDAHGVVFNAPLRAFLNALAHADDPGGAYARWQRDVRTDAWLGRIDDDVLWRRVLDPRERGDASGVVWTERLERCYHPGPAAGHLRDWAARVPLWLLSNHRSAWLGPRLERFGFGPLFERVLVSDGIDAIKPDRAAFSAVLAQVSQPSAAVFVDDNASNVAAARALGMRAIHARPTAPWVAQVSAALPPRGRQAA